MEIKVSKQEKLIKALIHSTLGLSFGSAQKLVRLGKVKVNGVRTKDNITVFENDLIETPDFNISKPSVEILYEDENVVIVFKPCGLECATRDKSSQNTYSLEELFDYKVYIVHRLDRLTEGIVILAKTKDVANNFEKYFRNGNISKHYMAMVSGQPKIGLYRAYLLKDSHASKVTISNDYKENSKEIITEIIDTKVYDENFSIVDILLHTGRTHQIRAHLAFLGHCIAGDSKYGSGLYPIDSSFKGYMLTAYKIEFHLDGNLEYLNKLVIEHKPTWLK